MSEIPRSENMEDGQEGWPTREKVFELLGLGPEQCVVMREEMDEHGLYNLVFTVEGEGGEKTEFEYLREGEYGTHKSADTKMIKTVYDSAGEFVTYPEHVFTFENGSWEKV